MQTLWLRFLTEIDQKTETVEEDLIRDELIREALECVSRDAFTRRELDYYDKFWDAVRVEKAAIEELTERNQKLLNEHIELVKSKEELAKQKEEERRLKEEERRLKEEERRLKEEALIKLAKLLIKQGFIPEDVAKETGLDVDRIKELVN